jgi:hypothetical protein
MITLMALVLLWAPERAPAAPIEVFARPLGITLQEAGLAEVEAALGPAVRSDDDHAFVCYVAPKNNAFVRFLVDGRGPGRRTVGHFTLRELTGEVAARCAPLSESAEARLERGVGGLRLGMKRAEVARRLGNAREGVDGSLHQHYTSRALMPVEELARLRRRQPGIPEDVTIRTDVVLSARFKAERLTELELGRSTGVDRMRPFLR